MKKVCSIGLIFILGMILFGCDQTRDPVKNANEEVPDEKEEKALEDNEANLVLHTGAAETVIRKIEGADQEVKVINYQIQPYHIAYQVDESFGVPEVKQNQITYSSDNDGYQIIIEMLERTNLEEVVSDLQEGFETEGYEESFELESLPLEENGLRGKMQFFGYPVKGFIAYEVDEHVLVITYQYPEVGGDGMYPLLASLRKSITVQ
ncbi:hypothetical protein [Sporosarcina sp. HYO08]|uniref:hypothetical protein n=1 Tax=Sporosarcina sp. HYO08 TaxID=1759557 RepID=UPI000791EF42|nr:hypothetical protein [Sporosarcina sp. HYO08]KXH86945.1 hypothetical protein AU377_13440 [Sporosarcina sp. HYO08]